MIGQEKKGKKRKISKNQIWQIDVGSTLESHKGPFLAYGGRQKLNDGSS
jgi:hypothetical protein